jgi:hypothetical protein
MKRGLDVGEDFFSKCAEAKLAKEVFYTEVQLQPSP